MAKIRVYQPKEEHFESIKEIIDVQEENPSPELLATMYSCVLETEEMTIPPAYMEEDILIDSVEGMLNASPNKTKHLGAYDVIAVTTKEKRFKILLLEDEEYEIISE
ncbi:hypothetical protein MUG87_02560 [Ectobacillus sp. JY-23]|uniref:hypothetical protein n=1 Tax=Ectobacillus sp. JY-23 TaxID=2933872 RepID=UPI001FF6AF3A|nr:hypothetical protein [Ectobacillus sp. JY-23]UOY93038.1 hypothetical protein MUG87_02560 [Ectobacillus sp. JY-23]